MKRKEKSHYNIKVIAQEGVSCVSVVDSGLHYRIYPNKEPDGIIFKGFKDKKKNRGQILRKLGIWETGQN